MSDGQFFVYYVLVPETAVILGGWWVWKRLQLRRARRAWIRRLDARQQRHAPPARRTQAV